MSMKRRVQSDGGRRCMVRFPSCEKKVGNIELGGNLEGLYTRRVRGAKKR